MLGLMLPIPNSSFCSLFWLCPVTSRSQIKCHEHFWFVKELLHACGNQQHDNNEAMPSCMHAKSLQSCLTLCDPMDGWPPAGLLCPWNSPGKNTGVDCQALLQGIFLTQGSNLHLLCLLHWQAATSATWEACRGGDVHFVEWLQCREF